MLLIPAPSCDLLQKEQYHESQCDLVQNFTILFLVCMPGYETTELPGLH